MASNDKDLPVIKRLDETVVNRIAAGEVVQRPANAVKELLENCLDAGSSSISVSIKSGGLKMLQISDNGHGIRREDMEIVCERFTTSKLKEFSDLRSIATFGFRGEALASISHVAHLNICTRTKDSKCAYRASYIDGKLKGPPRPTAGSVGTQITVEDLFYNVPTRRKALCNASEEHQKIADVISRYSIHNSGVAFTLRKAGEGGGGAGDISVRTQAGASVTDNIGNIFGAKIAKELIQVSHEDQKYKFKMDGYISNANCSLKKFIFLLFINHRLVDSTSLKRAIDSIYQAYLPKGSHPFAYLSLEIAACNVDVNVHPTKHEVHFLHEEEIIESVQKEVELKLRGCNSSRTFYTQTLLPTASGIQVDDVINQKPAKNTFEEQASAKVYEYQMVRTDSKLQKLDAFITNKTLNAPKKQHTPKDPTTPPVEKKPRTEDATTIPKEDSEDMEVTVVKTAEEQRPSTSGLSKMSRNLTTSSFPKRRQIKLTSVLQLQNEIKENSHEDLVKLVGDHTWVGCIDPKLAMVQHGTKLYMTNTTSLSEELFYQIMIFDFGNFGYLQLSEPAPIYELVMLALEYEDSGWTPADGNKEGLARHVVEILGEKSEMLKDYFSLEIKDGNIVTLPMLLPKYVPAMEGLPMFILRLTTEVDWESEIDCFRTFSRECARFYSIRKGVTDLPELIKEAQKKGEIPPYDEMETDAAIGAEADAISSSCLPDAECEGKEASEGERPWRWVVEHVIYRAFQNFLLPTKKMMTDGTFLQVANLPDLYKVFERC